MTSQPYGRLRTPALTATDGPNARKAALALWLSGLTDIPQDDPQGAVGVVHIRFLLLADCWPLCTHHPLTLAEVEGLEPRQQQCQVGPRVLPTGYSIAGSYLVL